MAWARAPRGSGASYGCCNREIFGATRLGWCSVRWRCCWLSASEERCDEPPGRGHFSSAACVPHPLVVPERERGGNSPLQPDRVDDYFCRIAGVDWPLLVQHSGQVRI